MATGRHRWFLVESVRHWASSNSPMAVVRVDATVLPMSSV